MLSRLLFFAAGVWLGTRLARPTIAADSWLEDLLMRGYAADQVADLSALTEAQRSAVSAVAGASSVPRGWLAELVTQGLPIEKLPKAAQDAVDALVALGPPRSSDPATLAMYRTTAIGAASAAGG